MPDDTRRSDDFSDVFFSAKEDVSFLEDRIEHEGYRSRLGAILSTDTADTSKPLRSVLRLGAEWFDVENGYLARIDPAAGTHTISEVSAPHPTISREATTDLSNTYCRKVLAENAALAVENAPDQGWRGDAAYEAYQFDTYLGAKVVVDGRLYGTVCFVDGEPRGEPFGESDAAALALITRTIGQELKQGRYEDRLRQTTARLKALFEDSPDMINIHDREGTLVFPNPRLCDETGYTAKELTRMKVWDLDRGIDPEEAEALWAEMEPGDRRRLEGRYRRKDGSTFPVEVDIRCLNLEEEDRFVATARNITERKERERDLRLFKQVIEQANDAVVVTDARSAEESDPRIKYVNSAFEDMTGYSREEIEGKTPRLLQGPETDDEVLDTLRDALQRGEPWSGETVNYRKDGTPYRLQWSMDPVRDEDGAIKHWLSIQRDVTKKRAREDQLRQ